MMTFKESSLFRAVAFSWMACALAHGAAAQDNGAASRDALEESIKTLHSHKDCEGLTGLFYTDGLEPERRRLFMESIINYVCSNFDRNINSIAFQALSAEDVKAPEAFAGKPSAFTLPPEGAVVLDYAPSDVPGQLQSFTLLYGRHDGKFYLVTTKQADAH